MGVPPQQAAAASQHPGDIRSHEAPALVAGQCGGQSGSSCSTAAPCQDSPYAGSCCQPDASGGAFSCARSNSYYYQVSGACLAVHFRTRCTVPLVLVASQSRLNRESTLSVHTFSDRKPTACVSARSAFLRHEPQPRRSSRRSWLARRRCQRHTARPTASTS